MLGMEEDRNAAQGGVGVGPQQLWDAAPAMDYCERTCQAHIIAPDKSMMQIGSQSTEQSIQIRIKPLLCPEQGPALIRPRRQEPPGEGAEPSWDRPGLPSLLLLSLCWCHSLGKSTLKTPQRAQGCALAQVED